MARDDYVAALPESAEASILEIGCSNGATGALALARGKCRRYCGVELFPEPAAAARERLTEVVEGDVEQLELPWPAQSFDALILSEVLEHLRDPWDVLERLRPLLRPGALVFASTPNVAHREIIVMLLQGRWELRSYGPLDATHLRWFSPSSLRQARGSWHVADPVGPPGARPGQRSRRSRSPRTSAPPVYRQIDTLRAHVGRITETDEIALDLASTPEAEGVSCGEVSSAVSASGSARHSAWRPRFCSFGTSGSTTSAATPP